MRLYGASFSNADIVNAYGGDSGLCTPALFEKERLDLFENAGGGNRSKTPSVGIFAGIAVRGNAAIGLDRAATCDACYPLKQRQVSVANGQRNGRAGGIFTGCSSVQDHDATLAIYDTGKIGSIKAAYRFRERRLDGCVILTRPRAKAAARSRRRQTIKFCSAPSAVMRDGNTGLRRYADFRGVIALPRTVVIGAISGPLKRTVAMLAGISLCVHSVPIRGMSNRGQVLLAVEPNMSVGHFAAGGFEAPTRFGMFTQIDASMAVERRTDTVSLCLIENFDAHTFAGRELIEEIKSRGPSPWYASIAHSLWSFARLDFEDWPGGAGTVFLAHGNS